MMDDARERRTSRRALLRGGAGAATGAGLLGSAGTVAGQTEEPEWPDFVQDAPNFQTTDLRGEDEVTVSVGAGDDGLLFDPSAIWIDPGTTVTWEWTGEGGDHNVTTEADASTNGLDFESDLTAEAGFTFEYTFDEEADGSITAYYCAPHIGVDMKGGVAVGDVPTVEVGAPDEVAGVPLPESARVFGVAMTVALSATLGLAYLFMKFGGETELE